MTFALFNGILERIPKMRRMEAGQPLTDAERLLERLEAEADN